MKTTFLVTGAAGFTGRHLCKLLQKKNFKFVPVNRSKKKAAHQYNLTNKADLLSLLKRVRPNGIFHCAGGFSNKWTSDFNANFLLTKKLLEAVKETSQNCRVLLIGSAAEYGAPKKRKISEKEPLKPVSIYGLTKKMQTILMEYYVRNFDMDIVMARTFNLFGKGCSPELFPGRVLTQAKNVTLRLQKKIKVSSTDSNRDYLHVEKAVNLYLQIMLKGKSGEIYNVGSGKSTNLLKILRILIKPYGLTFKNISINKNPFLNKRNFSTISANLSKLNNLLKKSLKNYKQAR